MAATTAGTSFARLVEVAHHHVDFDAVFVAEFGNGQQTCRAVAGAAHAFELAVGEAIRADLSDVQAFNSANPRLIRDASTADRDAQLPVTLGGRIGAYAVVPIRYPDGDQYGTLSCVSREPMPGDDKNTLSLLSLLAGLVEADLAQDGQRQRLRETITTLIESAGFDVAYQPVVDLSTGRCVGVEALARFPAPFTNPEQVFATAEDFGLGLALERAVTQRAWELVPHLGTGQYLAVNVSPSALLDLASRARSREELPLSKLVVEATEHSVIEAYASLRRELAPLRELGLRIAVDDAGAGYASLRHILELRPDFIKLDRWLIDGLADDRGRRVAVSAFVALARELGSQVIAEGVERPEDLAVIRHLGLDGAQGYLLGRPSLDRDEVLGWCQIAEPGESTHRHGIGAASPADGAEPPEALNEASDWSGRRGSNAGPRRDALGHELERFELDRRVSQRLEAVGQLAAGIAHEINTPLQFVGDSVSFLRDAVEELLALTELYRETLYAKTPMPVEDRRRVMQEAEERADVEYLSERIPRAFDRTVDGITRVRSIVQAMKRFSHAAGAEAAPADINEAIETTLAVCRNEYKYVAEVNLDLGSLPAVMCNIGELNQVILNLIINAAQAIEEKFGGSGNLGQIGIRTWTDDNMVVIEIADDGPGIPPALQDRIYEPFFTTKEIGKGTGQGLALALATIQRHSGSLTCVSNSGDGTTFTIRLPIQTTPADAQVAA
jgi:EAL domain-containing protein (putative c-di-GMP-specific phosphodiesterase class I)